VQIYTARLRKQCSLCQKVMGLGWIFLGT